MALFKTMKGLSKNFTREKVPFNDGYVYLTPDDEKLYMDSSYTDENGEKIEKRILINKGNEASYEDETLVLK